MVLRGYLTEQEIESDPLTGTVTLVNRSGANTQIQAWYATFAAAATAAGAEMVLRSGSGLSTNVRPVTGLMLKGISNKKLNNKYFNRAAAGSNVGLFDGLVEQYGPAVVGQIINYLVESGGGVPPLLP